MCEGQLTGLVSFGVQCALPKLPTYYADVRYHSEWIINTTIQYQYHWSDSSLDSFFLLIYVILFILLVLVILITANFVYKYFKARTLPSDIT